MRLTKEIKRALVRALEHQYREILSPFEIKINELVGSFDIEHILIQQFDLPSFNKELKELVDKYPEASDRFLGYSRLNIEEDNTSDEVYFDIIATIQTDGVELRTLTFRSRIPSNLFRSDSYHRINAYDANVTYDTATKELTFEEGQEQWFTEADKQTIKKIIVLGNQLDNTRLESNQTVRTFRRELESISSDTALRKQFPDVDELFKNEDVKYLVDSQKQREEKAKALRKANKPTVEAKSLVSGGIKQAKVTAQLLKSSQ